MTDIIPKEKRWKALALGTLMGFFGIAVCDLLTALVSMIGSNNSDIGIIFLISIYYVIIGLPIAFILCFGLGIPTFLILSTFTEVNRKTAIGMGIFMGVVFGLISFFLFVREYPVWFSILDLASTIAIGGFAGYWSFNCTKQNMLSSEVFD